MFNNNYSYSDILDPYYHNNPILTQYLLYMQFGGKKNKTKNRWTTLCHNGVIFPPEYEKHNVPVVYQGEKIPLDIEAEEVATMYARYKDTEYIKNSVFRKNFWKDWKKLLGKDHKIQSLDDCNFDLIYDYIVTEKEKNKTLSKEEKETMKKNKDEYEKKYKTAIVDGMEQPVGNFRIEPPGLFIGRGCHPKLGRIKKRIYPEDITINIGKECLDNLPATVATPIPGHTWGAIIHDKQVEWLASWKENITGKTKYVWLGTKSKFKAESDINKFELARKLKRKIKLIRDTNFANMSSTDIVKKQVATALYFIDFLALRVGNEKGQDEADTVGVTSLRVEHIKLLENNNVTLDFLGKDSIRYKKTFEVDTKVYNNLQEFSTNKAKSDELFEKITSVDMNKYLQSFMKDLTAKVFRTYNASYLFQKELNKVTKKYDHLEEGVKLDFILDGFNKANIKVALLCNHQKKVSKTFDDQMTKMNEKISLEQKKLRKIKNVVKNKERRDKQKMKINKLKAKRDLKLELRNISLDTSKTNYIDPRITVAFMKKHKLPIDKIFSKNLQEKFYWAFENIDDNWKF